MAVITSASHPKAKWPGINKWFGIKYKEKPKQCDMIFSVSSSDKAREEDVESTGFGLAPTKTEGSSISYDSHQQGGTATYIHTTYGLGYVVTREEIEDNKYSEVSRARSSALAFSMRQTEEIVCANVLNRAFNSSYTGYDAKELCATDHPTLYGDQSNELTVAADLSEASIESMAIQIRNARNSRGLRIAIKPRKLIVPPAEMFNAHRILKSTLRTGSAENDPNAIREMGIFPEGVFVYDYLTDADAWFIQTDAPESLKKFTRRAISFGQDNDFDTENAKAKATIRYSVGHSEWRGIFGSPGA